MKKNRYTQAFVALILLFAPLPCSAQGLFNAKSGPDIVVNNRVITTVYGHPLSVLDVQKEMDLVFFRQFPQYASSAEARYQFYEANFKPMGQQLIDKELILADAKENEMTIPQAEIRQEIEKIFGPNIINNLDQAGLTFDEAWKITESDLTIRRAMGARVHSKALKHVTPQKVRTFYQEYAKENQREESWDYRVITVRSKNSESAFKTAQNIYSMLDETEFSLDRLQKELKKRDLLVKDSRVSVTDEMKHTKEEIKQDYQEHLATLYKGSYSVPVALKSKKTGKMVYRIFCVNNYTPSGAPPFKEIESQLQNYLMGQEVQKETLNYLSKLRKRYTSEENILEESLPGDFKPFMLIQ